MKKKLLMIMLALLWALTALAQLGKGQHYAGGSLSTTFNEAGVGVIYNSNNGYIVYTTGHVFTFSVSPEIGFFLSDRWAVGIQPSYSRTSGHEVSAYSNFTDFTKDVKTISNYHTDIIGLAINFRYYWMWSSRFGLFPQFGISSSNNATQPRYGTFSAGGSPSLLFFPTTKLGVNMGFGRIAYNLDYQTKENTFNLNFNNNLSFGLNYYWGRK
ncbi:hypothetical protein BH09BAC6_BH09BAC6_18870 [soil metagenome]|jgi:hypothetical protein